MFTYKLVSAVRYVLFIESVNAIWSRTILQSYLN